MFLTEKQIKDYQDDGVIIIKDIFKDWIESLRTGFKNGSFIEQDIASLGFQDLDLQRED